MIYHGFQICAWHTVGDPKGQPLLVLNGPEQDGSQNREKRKKETMAFRPLTAGPKHSFFPWLGFACLSEKGAGMEGEGGTG